MDQQRPLKILFLTSSYPRNEADSAGVFLRYLAQSLSKRGVTVHVLAPSDSEVGTSNEGKVTVHRFQYLPRRLQKLAYGSGILPNLKSNPWLWIEVPFFLAAMSRSLLRLLRQERPDLVHAHWILPQGLVAVLGRLFYKVPVIVTAHGGDAFAFRAGLMGRLKRFVLHNSHAWTSNTLATSDALGQHELLPKPHVVPMGVDVNHFRSGQRTALRGELKEGEFLVLFVGRLVEKKGVENLLKAYTLLPAQLQTKTTLWVVGDGDQRSRLQQYSQALGINDRVCFWGQMSNHLLPDYYAAADLLVAPSVEGAWGDTEGQGVVLLEAFAARLCVLATRVGGIREVVEDGVTGMLAEPGNSQALARAIETLLDNPGLRQKLAHNAFARVRKDYNWERIATDFEDLYRELIEKTNIRSHNTGA